MIEVSFEITGGWAYVSSPDLPGLHLSGPDLGLLCDDVAEAIEVLIERNHGMKVKAVAVEDDWRHFKDAARPRTLPTRLVLQAA